MRKVFVVLALLSLLALAVMPAFAQERVPLPEALAADPDGRFTTLLAAIEAAGLTEALEGEGPFTILAPTNEAFETALFNLGLDAEDLLADTETLTTVLQYHVIPGQYFFRNLTSGPTLDTLLEGEQVTFNLTDGVFTVNGAGISNPDRLASNGIFHPIDAVLLPAAVQEAAAANTANIRVAHFSPDAGAVDIYLNDQLTELTGVTFGTISDWIQVPARSYRVGIAATGEEPGGVTLGNIQPGTWTTIAAVGTASTDDLRVRFIPEDFTPLADGTARLTVLHAISGAPVVDVLANGNLLIGTLGFPGSLGSNDGVDTRTVTAASYAIDVVANGTTEPVIASLPATTFTSGNSYFVAAIGTPTNPQLVFRTSNIAELTGGAPAAEATPEAGS